ncbi:ClpP/crotonase-like domain-containing protein [Massariosphaeria phaeospora]|uniref:Probable enoyl-CoA hydratase, mitochondrial n=1 Tax=Massariosphaeria phaeospora TaxID=100035 RepID=A0A7C8MPF9_9PLEO|nr:ClpP/crotonase-like domain-containing protein [Massariosphaeria phaeospora]
MYALRSPTRVASRFHAASFPKLVRGYASGKTYEHLLVSSPKPGVGFIQLNRPKALNALFTPLILELNSALRDFQADKSISAIVLTGSEKAFAAGADIKEMKDLTFSHAYGSDFIESWSDLVTFLKKPLITAINGYALGGGCELAMMGDILYCSSKAVFGQPEVKLGVIPGAGGSQRLPKAIGKSRAMDAILTGDNITAKQAGEWGLVAKVFETPEECVNGALATAEKIARYSQIAVKAAKEVVNKSQDLGIREGVEFERRVFHGLFGSQDQKIGMKAFAEKQKPSWTNE